VVVHPEVLPPAVPSIIAFLLAAMMVKLALPLLEDQPVLNKHAGNLGKIVDYCVIYIHATMTSNFGYRYLVLSRKKMDPLKTVPPGPNTLKYLDPPVRVLQNSTEVFGPF